jgi:Protein of unknown function (DUF1573)
MLRWIALAVFVVLLVGATVFMTSDTTIADPTPPPVVAPVATGPSAKLELTEPATFEFGTLPQLSGGKHTWEIKNVGEVDLEITMGNTTCSCTVAKLKSAEGEAKPKLVIKPGDSTKIDVEWSTKTFHDDYSQGVTLTTNDPAHASVSVGVHGKVHPPVIVVPTDTITFSSISNEQTQQAKIAVFSMDRPETKLTKFKTSRPEWLVARAEPLTSKDIEQLKTPSTASGPKAGHSVIVEIKPGMPLGRFQEELVIETDHPLKAELKITITGNMIGPISVIPDRVRMSSVSSSQGASRDLTLLVRGGKPTKFEVLSHPEKLDVKITPDDTATQHGRYKMTVTVAPGTSAGPVNGDIVLKTDNPQAATLKIPVTVLISNLGSN